MHDNPYLVDGKQAVQGFLAAEVLHIRSGRVAPIRYGSLDDILGRRIFPFFGTELLGRRCKVTQLLQHPLLAFHVHGVHVVVVVIDGEVLGVNQELVQLIQGVLAALL